MTGSVAIGTGLEDPGGHSREGGRGCVGRGNNECCLVPQERVERGLATERRERARADAQWMRQVSSMFFHCVCSGKYTLE